MIYVNINFCYDVHLIDLQHFRQHFPLPRDSSQMNEMTVCGRVLRKVILTCEKIECLIGGLLERQHWSKHVNCTIEYKINED